MRIASKVRPIGAVRQDHEVAGEQLDKQVSQDDYVIKANGDT